MAPKTKYRIPRATLEADRDVIEALAKLPDYSPANRECSVSNLQTLEAALTRSEQAESRSKRAYDVSVEQTTDAGWAIHTMVQAAKEQVVAQYGNDSNEVQMIGRKKRSQYKRPTRRTVTS